MALGFLHHTFHDGAITYNPDSILEDNNADAISELVSEVTNNIEGLDGLALSFALSYMFSDSQSFAIHYDKDYMDVYFTNYSAFHQIQAKHSVTIMNRVQLDTSFRFRMDGYEGIVNRTDYRLSAQSNMLIKLHKRVGFNIGGAWSQLASDPEYYNIEYDDLRINTGLIFGY